MAYRPPTAASAPPASALRRVNADMAAADADAIEELRTALSFEAYAKSFTTDRTAREVHVYVGPPNSGKTYAALRELAAAPSGAYLAPLRLLALEGRDSLGELGVVCDLVTGEDRDIVDGATHVSSTIECVDFRTPLDTVVIDEAQMLFDESRGWAWTQALLGAPARVLIILCAAHAEAAVRAVLRTAGETPGAARVFERKSGKLAVLDAPVKLADLQVGEEGRGLLWPDPGCPAPTTCAALPCPAHTQAGDAVVSFARMDALVTRDALLKAGREAAVIYGALPPEVRCRCPPLLPLPCAPPPLLLLLLRPLAPPPARLSARCRCAAARPRASPTAPSRSSLRRTPSAWGSTCPSSASSSRRSSSGTARPCAPSARPRCTR